MSLANGTAPYLEATSRRSHGRVYSTTDLRLGLAFYSSDDLRRLLIVRYFGRVYVGCAAGD